MFMYYLQLALRSLKRNRIMTALMVVAIAFGVAASMTTWSVFRAVSGDPIPSKSSELFFPQIDNAGPGHGNKNGELPLLLSYADAMNLMHAHKARYQSAINRIGLSIVPSGAGQHPFMTGGHAVFAQFFPMLDVPFQYGGPWTATDDAKRARVVVISDRLNDKLFGGADSVGRTININGDVYRITGVFSHWNPRPRFYDLVNSRSFSVHEEAAFIPFNTAVATGAGHIGVRPCPGDTPAQSGFSGLVHSDCEWVSFMVELDSANQLAAYRQFLHNYAKKQQDIGRFHWPPNVRLRDLPQWLSYLHVVPPDTKISLLVALGLFVVCLVNTTGLLLAKFMRRSGEIGVRRALGASRREICAQFLVEAGMVGLAGGVLGLVLTALGVFCVGVVMPSGIADLAHVDASLLGLTLLVAVVATALAGLYPTVRAAHVQPAWQLKTN